MRQFFVLLLTILTVACTAPTVERDIIERSNAITPADDAGATMPPASPDAGPSEDAMINQNAGGGWQSFGTLTTGDTAHDASLQANFPESGSYTLQFNIDEPPVAAGVAVPFVCKADVAWKVAGGLVRRTIDVGNGTTISGVGQAVDVRVYDDTPTLDASNPGWPAGGNQYKVSMQVSKGIRASTQQPVTLAEQFQNATGGNARSYVNTLAAGLGTELDINIPQDAGVISVEVAIHNTDNTPLAEGDVFLIQANASTISKIYRCPLNPEFIDVSPATTLLTVRNNHAKAVYVSVTWGIDG